MMTMALVAALLPGMGAAALAPIRSIIHHHQHFPVPLPTVRTRAPRCCAPGLLLNGVQRRQLRSHAGRLAAAKTLRYVSVADVERSATEVSINLDACELVRCRFSVLKKAEAKVMATEMASATGAAVAEVLGHTALLYRPSPRLDTASRIVLD